MSPKSEDYRRRAVWCEEQGKRPGDQMVAEEFRKMAERWRQMAEQAERQRW